MSLPSGADTSFGPVDAPFLEHAHAAPSSVWAVFDRTGVVHWGSTGALDDGSAPTDTTAYRIASCTKSFTAAAVLALRDDGALQLGDPITRLVPEFAAVTLPTADSPVPTIGMLLTMSAGLPTDDPWADRQEAMSDDQFTALLLQGLSFESIPGTRFAYSNLSFALLGRVIERAGGLPYRDLITSRFLEPLGLAATAFDTSVRAPGGIASGYRANDDGWERLPFSTPGAFSPIGGLFTTAGDLTSWALWLSGAFDGETAETCGPRLSRASRRELQQLHRFAPGRGAHPCGYGFGLFVEQYPREGPVVFHSGGYPGFSAHMRWSAARGLGIVAFANATGARVSVPATAAFDALLQARPGSPNRLTWPRLAWPQAALAREAVTGLIEHWSDEVAASLFSENVALDDSFEHRRGAIAAAVGAIGGLTGGTAPSDEEVAGAASHQIWQLSGRTGDLRVEILLTPENPPRVQTLKVAPAAVSATP